MSVSTTTDRVTYSGNGATVDFAFGYVLYSTSDLKVYLKNNTTGAETLQTITTHYTVAGTLTAGVYESGVTVTFLTAPTASQTVLIYRDRDVTQELELDENGKIPSASLEKQLDKLTTYVQRVKNKQARSVALPEGFTATFTPDLPPVMVTDGYLKTNAAGDGFEYISEADLIGVVQVGGTGFTASRALQTDANGDAESSSVTTTELGYVSGVTSAIQTQLNTNATAISDHLADTIDAHDASAISSVPSGNLAATDVQAALNELQSDIDTRATSTALSDHINDATAAHAASAISNTPSGNLVATTVQAALDEIQTELDGVVSGSGVFSDAVFTIQDNSDATKQAKFELSGITTGTTRTLTVPNVSGLLGIQGDLRSTSKTTTYSVDASTDDIVYCDSTSGAFTVTIPSAASNPRKVLILKKTDSSFNAVTLSGTGMTTNYLMTVGETAAFQSDGSNWVQIWRKTDTPWISFTPTGSWNTSVTYSGYWKRVGDSIEIQYSMSASGQPNTGNFTINIPNSAGWTINTSKMITGSEVKTLGHLTIVDLGTAAYHGILAYSNTTSFIPTITVSSTSYLTGTAFDRNIPMTWASGDVLYIKTSPIPITNFSE